MKTKLIEIIIFIFVFLFYLYEHSSANEPKLAFPSANIVILKNENENLLQYHTVKTVIEKVLKKYNSPMSDFADVYAKECIMKNIDCYLVPAISGIESKFGIYIIPGSYNPFGWGGGSIRFDSWEDAIKTVIKGIKNNYILKGAKTIEQIAPIYAPSSTSWSFKVRYFKSIFEKEELKLKFIRELI